MGISQEKIDTAEVEEVVVSASRNTQRKDQSAIPIFVIDGKKIQQFPITTLGEGLNFAPGLRVETNCQTCNYTQLRMNGLGGSYSQILINGRSLFSSLMGLYGLEQISVSNIERIEIIRGAGSVLSGTNAVGGTVNVITKFPNRSNLTISNQTGFVSKNSGENTTQLNADFISKNKAHLFSIFAVNKYRSPYDVNGDGYSELPHLFGQNVGLNYGFRGKNLWELDLGIWYIQEKRRGGNAFNQSPQDADQAEFRNQKSVIVTYRLSKESKNKRWKTSLFGGNQHTSRSHYTGVDHANGWGTTRALSIQMGAQQDYGHFFLGGKMNWNLASEVHLDAVDDRVPGYHYQIKQRVLQWSSMLQNNFEISKKWNAIAGIRLVHYSPWNKTIGIPRIALLYKPNGQWQFRASYGEGFKAPQAFESDLHMAFASGGVTLLQYDPNLKGESSRAFASSIDFNRRRKKSLYQVVISGFYSQLNKPFQLEEIAQDSIENTQLLRTNGKQYTVYGISVEFRWKWSRYLQTDFGFTEQRSLSAEPIRWSNEVTARNEMLRSPNRYGYLTWNLFPDAKLSGQIASVYTGSMWVPHFGGSPENPHDVIIQSKSFLDVSCFVTYTLHKHIKEQTWKITIGVNNVLNQYQSDFDTGKYRDSNYIYGPSRPRSVQFKITYQWGVNNHEANR